MKLNLQTKLLADYNPIVKTEKQREERKAREEKEQKEKEAWDATQQITGFTLGTTPNFVIDLNEDLVQLEDINQLTVTFGQFGKQVQKEVLYFSDNWKYDSEGHIIGLDEEVYEEFWTIDDDGNMIKTYNTIKNPKFTYDKVLNHLVLTLSQQDTLTNFKPTNWLYHTSEAEAPELPFIQGNPSLVVYEVKMRLNPDLGRSVVVKPQKYLAVADVLFDDPIFKEHRDFIYYDSYAGDGYKRSEDPTCTYYNQLPRKIELLKNHHIASAENLVRYGWYHKFPKTFTSDVTTEVAKYACIAIPTNIKIKCKSVKVLYGGSLGGLLDYIQTDSEGRVIPSYKKEYATLKFNSTYVVDTEGATVYNPRGEYIVWYVDPQFKDEFGLLFQFERI